MKCNQDLVGYETVGGEYGVSIANSENINLSGEFHGNRHAVTHGGGTISTQIPVVTYNCHHKGRFTSLIEHACDFHGNTECSSFSGTMTGVTIAGHNNKVENSYIFNYPKNIVHYVVYFSELKSIMHSFSGSTIESFSSTSNGRGVIDVGWNSEALTSNADKAGILNLSNTNIITSAPLGILFTFRNRGLIARLGIDITNAMLQSPITSEAAIYIQNITGNKVSILNKTGINLVGGTVISIPGVDTVIG